LLQVNGEILFSALGYKLFKCEGRIKVHFYFSQLLLNFFNVQLDLFTTL
jgi:hypothetical protein